LLKAFAKDRRERVKKKKEHPPQNERIPGFLLGLPF
jgi:hypothetical protein